MKFTMEFDLSDEAQRRVWEYIERAGDDKNQLVMEALSYRAGMDLHLCNALRWVVGEYLSRSESSYGGPLDVAV